MTKIGSPTTSLPTAARPLREMQSMRGGLNSYATEEHLEVLDRGFSSGRNGFRGLRMAGHGCFSRPCPSAAKKRSKHWNLRHQLRQHGPAHANQHRVCVYCRQDLHGGLWV